LGVCLLILAAPFESLTPFIDMPGQSLSNLETVLLIVVSVWLAALSLGQTTRSGLARVAGTPLVGPWLFFLGAMFVAALAGVDRINSLHMAGRFSLACCVFLLTVDGVTTVGRLRAVVIAAAVAGAIVAVLAVLEYLGVEPVLQALTAFRPRVAVIGAQVRASGPLLYPTIASMFLEIVFALTLGLLLLAIDADRDRPSRTKRLAIGALVVGVLLMSEAVTLTFTRSGLIAMAASLAVLATFRVWLSRFDRGTKALLMVAAVVVFEILTSRSFESLRLRLTTEGQEDWYRATVSVPAHVTLQAGSIVSMPLTVTNIGRSTWDSHAVSPFRLSYHWLLADADIVVRWEGMRTEFPDPVLPGGRATLAAWVEAPAEPGDYRLVWDIEQEKRLWFSGEPDMELSVSSATIRGPAVSGRPRETPRPFPRAIARPRRGVLWRAVFRMVVDRPVLGVGPDNYRLIYGDYAGIAGADPRVHSNNMYLEMLAGGGLVGGLAFIWFCWQAARRVVRPVVRPSDPRVATMAAAVSAAAAAIALHGLADVFLGFTGTYILIAIVLGLAVAGDALNEADAHRI
jgi:hypothetical protein